jgi:hypothetical protein
LHDLGVDTVVLRRIGAPLRDLFRDREFGRARGGAGPERNDFRRLRGAQRRRETEGKERQHPAEKMFHGAPEMMDRPDGGNQGIRTKHF